MRGLLKYPSTNVKTGPIATLTLTKGSCPTSCALSGKGCYAENGPIGMLWARVNRGSIGVPWDEVLGQVRALPRGVMLRYGQAGDLPGEGDRVDGHMLFDLVAATRHLEVIAYTHKPVLGDDRQSVHNRELIERARRGGLLINFSADNPAHADWLSELGTAPVVTVVANAYARKRTRAHEWAETLGEWRDRIESLPSHTPGGRRLAVCPATYTDTTCEKCRACAKPRDAIIAFPAHGRWRVAETSTGNAA